MSAVPGLSHAAQVMWQRLTAVQRSRTTRLSFSVMMVIASVLLFADLFGLRHDEGDGVREIRQALAEALAVQLATLASTTEEAAIHHSVAEFVRRNESVLAARLSRTAGAVVAEFGEVSQIDTDIQSSSLDALLVPILDGQQRWGELRVSFRPDNARWVELQYFGFVLICGFFACMVFLYRALMQLDPSGVVPERVSSAFDMFTEGVVILDKQLRVLLANRAVAAFRGVPANDLVGGRLEDWEWKREEEEPWPWEAALKQGVEIHDRPLWLDGDPPRLFMISAAVIGESDGEMRGVMVTLDDLTELERKNRDLASTLTKLKRSQASIEKKNEELEALASRDPLTGLLNRRALMETGDQAWEHAHDSGEPLTAIMSDIDHFKQVNDTYGHAVGDEVICAVANVLTSVVGDAGVVGRYGGEEFVTLLPGHGEEDAVAFAERARIGITELVAQVGLPLERLSSSFGVAEITDSDGDIASLVDRADQALYTAKESGRNRVMRYDPERQANTSDSPTADTPPEQRVDGAAVENLQAEIEQRDLDLARLRDFDEVTGSPRRSVFLIALETEISRAARSESSIGVLALGIRDVAGLRASFGAQATDQLLVELVERLQDGLRRSDLVTEISTRRCLSRVDADEFAILLTDLENSAQAISVATRLRRLLSQPFEIATQSVYLGASLGIALYPQGGDAADKLLETALEARESASRRADKFAFHVAADSLDRLTRDYIALEADLYHAFEARDFSVNYQPKLDLASGRIVAFESLVRWEHPTLGFVSPVRFIPLAEANGLVHDIFAFVLRETLRCLVELNQQYKETMRASVNVSAVQLREPMLVPDILKAVKTSGIAPEQLEIELTETSVIESPNRARIALKQLREAGVTISMDDFGTGYTSLALLADLPLDAVKIDRSFVSAMEDDARSQAVVQSVVNMAHALNLRVVGEGVETPVQLQLLKRFGCDEVQGYLVSKPLSEAAFRAHLSEASAGRGNVRAA